MHGSSPNCGGFVCTYRNRLHHCDTIRDFCSDSHCKNAYYIILHHILFVSFEFQTESNTYVHAHVIPNKCERVSACALTQMPTQLTKLCPNVMLSHRKIIPSFKCRIESNIRTKRTTCASDRAQK